jgi:hypothetical protein
LTIDAWIPVDRTAARTVLANLIARYADQRDEIERAGTAYSESQARTDFIDPLLAALGWDLTNQAGLAYSRREVVVEPSLEPTAENPYAWPTGLHLASGR